MITGFNPADMYAADHIKRVLHDVPGRLLRHRRVHDPQGVRVGEDRGRDGEPDEPRARPHPRLRRRGRARGASCTTTSTCRSRSRARSPYPVVQLGQLLKRHPKTTIIWAHCGLGRIVHPVQGPDRRSSSARSSNPELAHVYIDISWDEVAKYLRGDARDDPGRGGPDQPPPGPLPVRHRRGGPDRAGEVPEGLRPVRAAVREADAGGEREAAQGQLRAALRRGAPPGARVGEGATRSEEGGRS